MLLAAVLLADSTDELRRLAERALSGALACRFGVRLGVGIEMRRRGARVSAVIGWRNWVVMVLVGVGHSIYPFWVGRHESEGCCLFAGGFGRNGDVLVGLGKERQSQVQRQ